MRNLLEKNSLAALGIGFLVTWAYRWSYFIPLQPKGPSAWPHFWLGSAYDAMAASLLPCLGLLLFFWLKAKAFRHLQGALLLSYQLFLYVDYIYLGQFGTHIPFSTIEYLEQAGNFTSTGLEAISDPYFLLLGLAPYVIFLWISRKFKPDQSNINKKVLSLVVLIVIGGSAGAYANGYLSKNLNDPLISTGLHYFYWSRSQNKLARVPEPQWAWTELAQDQAGKAIAEPKFKGFPLAREFTPNGCKQTGKLAQSSCGSTNPNIIFLFLESFRSAEVGALGGPREITPEFDRWAERGILYSNFLANGFQTRHGQFAAYCGIMPNYGPPVMRHYHQQSYRCLPQLLKEAGYQTQWLTSADSSFDNQGTFLRHIGFDQVIDKFSFPDDTEVIGWGYSDESLFDFWLQEIDQLKPPFFTSTITITNHHPFEAPEKYHVLSGKKPQFKFHNSMHYTSAMVAQFLDKAEQTAWWGNSLIFIFGDTSNYQAPLQPPQSLAEFIRLRSATPLLITGGLVKKSARIEHPASQIDLAPTVMDYLGQVYRAPFAGQSLLAEKSRAYTNRPGNYWAVWEGDQAIYNEERGRKESQGNPSAKEIAKLTKKAQAWREGIRWLLQEDQIWPRQ